MNREQLQAALQYDPFEGDRGDFSDRTFEDKIVLSRVGGECHCCRQDISPKTLVRTRKDFSDGEFLRFRWCNRCTELMAEAGASNDDVSFNAMDKLEELYGGE